LPFLRFTRDKRGYETTSLVHSGRRNGRSRQRILYWFRTPPGVKVGRPALDEGAIRWIEEHNPDIEFDWPKILEAKPQAPPAPPAKASGQATGRAQQRAADRSRSPRQAQPRPARPREQPPADLEPGSLEPEPSEPQPEVELGIPEPEREPERELEPELEPLAYAFEQLTHPDVEELVEPSSMPVEQTLGREDLTRLLPSKSSSSHRPCPWSRRSAART
jgi:hypothetical protein